jgi:uncharacterized phage infection (PIP) family protein YhgE
MGRVAVAEADAHLSHQTASTEAGELDLFRAEVERLQSELSERSEAVAALQSRLEEMVSNEHLSGRSSTPGTPGIVPSKKRSRMFSPGLDDGSPSSESGFAKTPSGEQADVLRNYMRNQLELQESEWESYEETINSLTEQLELAMRESAAKSEEISILKSEKDELLSSLVDYTKGSRAKELGQISNRPPQLVVENLEPRDYQKQNAPNIPSSVRSNITLSSWGSSAPSTPYRFTEGGHGSPVYTFDFSNTSDLVQEQVEKYKAHMEQQVIRVFEFLYSLLLLI